MTPEERVKLDAFFEERTREEMKFLCDNGAELNEYGVYIYQSTNGNSSINLALFLRGYRDYLIENDIVKENIWQRKIL